MKLFSELRRREVWKTLALYIVGAWVVIQGADLIFPGWCIAESAIRHVWIAVWLGLPIALVVSWQFDISTEGLRRTTSSGSGSRALVRSDYALLMTLSVIMVGIVVMQGQAVLATRDCGMDRPFDPPDNSIAVLPFVSLSANEEDAWLGTAFADTVLDSLANLPGTLVIDRRSSFDPRLKGMSAREVAILLGVAFVLEGSVQRQGDRLRITPQIIDARENSHYWSSKIDRTYSDLFDIQDEVAEAAASAVQVVFSQEDKQRIDREGTDNLAALEEYARAIRNMQVRTTESIQRAAEHLQKAIELDPTFAKAYASLGFVYTDQVYRAWSGQSFGELRAKARDAAARALELAPGMPSALTLLASLTNDDFLKNELYQQAIRNGPNNTLALKRYAEYLFHQEFKVEETMALGQKVLQLDPLDEENYLNLTWVYAAQRRVPEFLELIARAKERERIRDSVLLRDNEALAHALVGDYSSAIVAKYETLSIDPHEYQNRTSIAGGYLFVGMPEQAERWFEQAIATAPDDDPYARCRALSLDIYFQRDDEKVFSAMQQCIAEMGWNLFFATFVEYGARLERLDEVLEIFEAIYPHYFSDPPTNLDNDRFRGVTLDTAVVGLAMLLHGDTAPGETLFRSFLQAHEKVESYWVEPLAIDGLLALGETEKALDLFRIYADRKWIMAGFDRQNLFRHSSLYDPIRNEPEFIELLEVWETNAAEQRQLLQAMDLPVR